MTQIEPTARQLLQHLHRGGTWGYWWTMPHKVSSWWKISAPAGLPNGKQEIYFGLHPTSAIPPTNPYGKPVPANKVRSQLAYIAALNCLYCEFDAKDFGGDKAAARAAAEALEPRYSVLVDSGGGYHVYHLLVEPWLLATEDDHTQANKLQAAWVAYAGSDPAVKDLARVLRVPGTLNHKYDPPRPVTFVTADFDVLYDRSELAAYCAHLMADERLNGTYTPRPVTASDRKARYAESALNNEVANVVRAPANLKHDTIRNSAIKLGTLIGAGLLDEMTVADELANAANLHRKDVADTIRTVRDGIAYGTTRPRALPDFTQPLPPHTDGVSTTNGHVQPDPSYVPPPPVTEPWGAIVPFDSYEVPAFPTHVFPSWLRAYVEAVAEATQTPPDLAGMLALSVLALCGQRWIFVEATPKWTEPTNLFTATTQPPASRKSAVFRRMVAIIDQYEQTHGTEARIAHATAEAQRDVLEQRLEAAKKDAAKASRTEDQYIAGEEVQRLAEELELFTLPSVPRYVVSDVTAETLATLMYQHDGRMAALSPEGDIFALMAGRYSSNGGANFNIYLNAHAGDDIRIDRRGRSEYINYPTLTIGITTQPDVIRGLAGKTGFRELGLLARFLYSTPASLVGHRKIDPDPVPDDIQAEYEAMITRILDGRTAYSANSANSANKTVISNLANIYLYSLSADATVTFRGFRTWLEPLLGTGQTLGDFADWAGKLAGATARIAALLQMAVDHADSSSPYSHNSHNSQNEITDVTMGAAIELANYLTAHARAAFAQMGSDPAVMDARRALTWLQAKEPLHFTKRDMFEGIKGSVKKADDLDPILKVLADHSYIRPVDAPARIEKKGRPASQPYEVNPELYSHNSHNSQNVVALPAYTPPFIDYAVECVSMGATDEWRVLNEVLNQVVATYTTEAEAMDDAHRRAKRLPLAPRSNYRALGGY